MHRFIRPSFLQLFLAAVAVALSGSAHAAVISMTSAASFTGGLDLAINSPDNTTTTRLTSTLNAASSTIDLTGMGQVDWLALGTLRIGEGINDTDTAPNITAAEFNDGYQLAIDINTNIGLLSFIANSGLFSTLNFDPGGSDADTTDAAAEISVDFSTLSQTVTIGLITYSLSIVDNQFSSNGVAAGASDWHRRSQSE
jgi:hypothetical protein